MARFKFLGLLLLSACTYSQSGLSQTQRDISKIEFNSETRGYREHVTVTPDSVTSVEENSLQPEQSHHDSRKCTVKEWTSLLNSFKDVRLTEIETLESPSMKRAFDGAAHSSIVITTAEGKTYSHGFDDEAPHKKLSPLVREIRKTVSSSR